MQSGIIAGQTVPVTIQNSGTITSETATGITLVGGGTVNNASGGTIYGYFKGIAATLAATIANAGAISAGNYGVSLAAGGTISNAASSTITGYFDGIVAAGKVAITNAGTIASGVANNSLDGVVFAAGTLSNAAGGTISGHQIGVYVTAGGTVINAGTIAGGTDAVKFNASGGRLVLDPGAVFTGTVFGGNQGTLELAGTAAGTLAGLGSKYVGFKQVTIDAGANWTLAGTNTQPVGVSLLDSGTLTVAGSFSGTAGNYGYLGVVDAGSVTDQGSILGAVFAQGLLGPNTRNSVTNLGTIHSGAFGAVQLGGGSLTNGSSANHAATIISAEAVSFLSAPGTVTNYGTITGTNANLSGVRLNFGGIVSNAAGALITGQYNGVLAIAPIGQPLALVQNAGTIIGAGPNGEGVNALGAMVDNTNGGLISGNAFGIELQPLLVGGGAPPRLGGAVQNGVDGTVSGGTYGVLVMGGGTVANAGTITGGTDAVRFFGGSNRLIEDPGAVFNGGVVATGGTSDVLELGAGAGGIGTLAGLDTEFVGFGTVTVDPGATWQLASGTTITTAETLVDSGSLSASSFFNRGIVSVVGGQFTDATTLAAGTGTGTLDIGAGGTATLAAGSAADQTIAFTAAGGTLAITAGMTIATPITGFAAGDTVRIINAAVTRLGIAAGAGGTTQVTAFAGNQAIETLSFATPPLTGLFGFAPDAAGGSDLAFAPGALLNGVLSVPGSTAGITYEAPPGVAAVALGGAAAVGLEDTTNGNLLLSANTGADTITSAVAGDTLAGGGGAAVLDGTAGQNTVFRDGGCSVRMTGGNGNDIFIGTTGSDTVTTGTGANLIVPGSGNDLILSSGNDVLFPDTGGSETVFAAGHLLAAAGAGTMFLINGANPASVIGGGSGSVVINGGAGGGLFAGGTGGENVIFGGTGQSVLFGSSGSDLLFAGGANADLLIAGSGNETLSGLGSTGANVFYAGAGADLLGGEAGAETFIAGHGSSTVIGGTGSDLYGFINGFGGGSETVFGFNAAKGDHISLQGYGANAVQAALGSATVAGGSTTLTLSDHTSVTFIGVTGLNAANFV